VPSSRSSSAARVASDLQLGQGRPQRVALLLQTGQPLVQGDAVGRLQLRHPRFGRIARRLELGERSGQRLLALLGRRQRLAQLHNRRTALRQLGKQLAHGGFLCRRRRLLDLQQPLLGGDQGVGPLVQRSLLLRRHGAQRVPFACRQVQIAAQSLL
jgi:hypothetical protein